MGGWARLAPADLLSYEQYQAACAPYEQQIKEAGKVLAPYPKGAMGLTPDEAKDAPWHAAMRTIANARYQLQKLRVTQRASSRFKKEARAERDARRAAWGQPKAAL